MERITGKEVQSMMEAYASVHEVKEQEVISEETLAQKNARTQKENEEKLAAIAYLRRQRRERNQKLPVSNLPSDLKDTEKTATAAGQRVAGKPMGGLPADYKKTELEAGKTAERSRTGAGLPTSGGGTQGQGSTKPAPNPNVTSDGTKFERRLPTMDELRAAQAARKAAPKVLSRREIENRAITAGVNAGKPAPKPATGGPGGYQVPAAAMPKTRPAPNPAAAAAAAKAAEVKKPVPRPGARNRGPYLEEVDIFDTIKEHLISEHELSEDVAIQVMTLLDEETRGEIMEYTAAIRADAAPKGTTVKMTADGKEPVGDKLLKGIKDRVGGFLRNLNPNALKSTTVEPRKPLVATQKNSYELEGELVDEGSCGSKKKKKSKKGGY